MGEDLLDLPRQAAPAGRERGAVRPGRSRPLARPGRPWEFDGRGEQAPSAGAAERGRRRPPCARKRPRPLAAVSPSPWLSRDRSPARRSGTPRNRPEAGTPRNPGCAAGRSSRRYPSAPVRNRRRGGVARAPRAAAAIVLRDSAIGASRPMRRARMRAMLPSTGAAGDRRRSPRSPPRYRRRRPEAAAQRRLVGGEPSACARDRLGAGVQVSRPRVVAEPGEGADHGLERRGGQILDPRPFLDEGPVVGRRGLRRRLLQQHFGEPDPIGVRRLARLGAPGELASGAVPPRKRARDDRVALSLEPRARLDCRS